MYFLFIEMTSNLAVQQLFQIVAFIPILMEERVDAI